MKPTKAIGYSRFSPRPNSAECQSVEAQASEYQAYCVTKRYHIVGEFSDKALSGGSDDRPGLEQAIAALKRGYVLVATSMDRIARGNGLAEAILLKVAGKGAFVETCDGVATRFETKEMRMLRGVKQVFAEYQKAMIQETTSRRMLEYQKAGRRMGSILPYGMRDAGERIIVDPRTGLERTQRLTEPCPDEQAALELMRQLRAAGTPLVAIGKELERRGILCRGRPWCHTTIMRVLRRGEAVAVS